MAQCVHLLPFCHLSLSLKVRATLLVAEKLLKCDFISRCVMEGPRAQIHHPYVVVLPFDLPMSLFVSEMNYNLSTIPGMDQKLFFCDSVIEENTSFICFLSFH